MLQRAALTALAAAVAVAAPSTLRRVVSSSSQSLDSADGAAWTLSNGSSTTLSATVPGDLISDLEANGVVPDPLVETNFRGNTTGPEAVGGVAWDASPWTFSLSFTLQPELAAAEHVALVFEGVKMVADVALNGVPLGVTADQFLRYTFDASAVERASANVLTVTFPTFADARNIERRWMACSGGWECVAARSPRRARRAPPLTPRLARRAQLQQLSVQPAGRRTARPRASTSRPSQRAFGSRSI